MKYLISSILAIGLLLSSSVFGAQSRPINAYIVHDEEFSWVCVLAPLTQENAQLSGAPLACMKVMTEQLVFNIPCQTSADYTYPLDCKGQQQEKKEKYTF